MKAWKPRPRKLLSDAYWNGTDGSYNLYPARGHQYAAWVLGLKARELKTMEAKKAA